MDALNIILILIVVVCAGYCVIELIDTWAGDRIDAEVRAALDTDDNNDYTESDTLGGR